MAIQAQETLEAKELSAVADKGYYSGREILMCDSVGITAYVAKPLTSANTARGLCSARRSFAYDPARDVYVCPAKQLLTYRFSTDEKGAADPLLPGERSVRVARSRGSVHATKPTARSPGWRSRRSRKRWRCAWPRTPRSCGRVKGSSSTALAL